jgi:hypothetical protein
MSLLLLLAALLPWAASPAGAIYRTYLAIGLLSIEMQIVTLSGVGSLYALPFVNTAAAIAIVLWQRRKGPPSLRWTSSLWTVAPWQGVLCLGAVVVGLNLLLPLEAADPYHLERIAQIERQGTLDYDPAADPKVNILGWVYELVVADVRQGPLLGSWLVRLHGVFGLLLYLLALATAREWLPPSSSRWPWLVLLTVPVLFHQFVLIKNDLFIAVPAFVALVWLIVRASEAPLDETAGAGALVGFVIGCKLTNLPLAIVLAGGVFLARRPDVWRPLGALASGGALGALAGGLFFTLLQNARWYGDIFASGAVASIGNMASGPLEAAGNVLRFAISLVDLGLVTPEWWPGRGGWGSTFGLPFIWAAAVLIAHARHSRHARWALAIAGAHFLAFAATFPDADVSQRLVLASGLLVVCMATLLVGQGGRFAPLARRALVPVLVLSAAQVLRSALLYLWR